VGYLLFQRHGNRRAGLVLTEPASRALPDIQAGFDRQSLGMTRLREGATGGTLNITLSPALAAKWLLPRIEDLQSRWPDIDIRLPALSVQDDNRTWRRVRLCPNVSLRSPRAWYFVCQYGCENLPRIALFFGSGYVSRPHSEF